MSIDPNTLTAMTFQKTEIEKNTNKLNAQMKRTLEILLGIWAYAYLTILVEFNLQNIVL